MSERSKNSKPDLMLITRHIESLKRDEPEWSPYGRGNPYSYCADCEASNIEGHQDTCRFYELKRLTDNLELMVELIKTGGKL